MMRAHLAVLPDVDLGIDDQHGFLLMKLVATGRDPVIYVAGYSIGMKIEWRILPST